MSDPRRARASSSRTETRSRRMSSLAASLNRSMMCFHDYGGTLDDEIPGGDDGG